MPETARITVNVFDGTRNLIGPGPELLITIRDGHQRQIHRDFHSGPTVTFEVPFYNNFGDNYTVLVAADRFIQAGFAPIKVSPISTRVVDLMLLPREHRFDFTEAEWHRLRHTHHKLFQVLASGAPDDGEAEGRYEEFKDRFPGSLAALLNIVTAMRDILLPTGNAFGYLKQLVWKEGRMKQDRFFAFADLALLEQVKRAAAEGLFAPQFGLDFTHPGATSGFKHVQFGEANVQLCFHENNTAVIDEVRCVMVEADMDYYKDPLAHLLLEVLPNKVSGGKTDPRRVYLLRWIAGRHAGVPEFDPPFTIVPR